MKTIQLRKRKRSYTVTADNAETKVFIYLRAARNHALSLLGANVAIYNNHNVRLPL